MSIPTPRTKEDIENTIRVNYEECKGDAVYTGKHLHLTDVECRKHTIQCLACETFLPFLKNDKDLDLSENELYFAKRCAYEKRKTELKETFEEDFEAACVEILRKDYESELMEDGLLV